MYKSCLCERGIDVTHEAIRQWCLKFWAGLRQSAEASTRPTRDKWHLDEVFLTIHGERHGSVAKFDFGQNPKIGYQEFNDLHLPFAHFEIAFQELAV